MLTLKQIAEMTHGFVLSLYSFLCREAGMPSSEEILKKWNLIRINKLETKVNWMIF
jgi:SpoVK/Ycf46/Vps4 family AAA+-type ATPase